MKPNGAAVMMVSPPRAVRGDPQPGLHSHMSESAPNAASELNRPIRPNPDFCSPAGSAWITGGCSIREGSELHLDRLTGRLQRTQVELDINSNFLANDGLGYSP